MKLKELTQITIKYLRPAKERAKCWNLDTNHTLREAIEECLATGKEVLKQDSRLSPLYRVSPQYPLIDSAMQDKRNQKLIKLTVTLFNPAMQFGVEGISDTGHR